MKSSDTLIWEMNAKLRTAGNVPVRRVCIICDKADRSHFAPRSTETFADKDELVSRLFSMSLLGKYIKEFGMGYWVSYSHCILDVYVADSGDCSTNIDGSLLEAVSQLKWVS